MSAQEKKKAPLVWIAQGVWFEDFYRGVCRYAHRHGWRIDASLRFSRGPVAAPTVRPDGVIVFTLSTPGLEEAVKTLRDAGIPIVDTEAYVDRYGAPRVLGDDARVGELAAAHLAATNPVRLYAVFHAAKGPVSQARRVAFLRQAEAAGVPATVLTPGDFRVVDLIREGHAGLYASGETLAVEALRECLESGVRVPEDLAILSGDDFGTICENTPVPLSSVDLAMEEKGWRAAELLDRLMRGESPPAKPVIVPPAGVVERESTRLAHSGDDRLDGLIRHLKDHCHRRVGLAELCEEYGMPLRTAQHLLKTRLATAPGKLLREFRLKTAERLEKAGDLKKESIARAVGYSGRSGLSRARRPREK